MNYSTAVFLINNNIRAVLANYENEVARSGEMKKVMFKTFDHSIAVGDICVVPASTRHGFTTVKIMEVDVNVDFDSQTTVDWIVDRVDISEYKQNVTEENQATETIKSAEMRKRRQTLMEDLITDREAIKALPIYSNGETK
jgi:hypothetical protein